MGSLNSDCWYMYTMKDFSRPSITSEPDQTIEILMSELDTEIMDIFHQHTSATAKEAREVCSNAFVIFDEQKGQIGTTVTSKSLFLL